MDRYRNVFEEALARVRQQQGPAPGSFSPAAFGYPVPDAQMPDFLPPSTGPIGPTWEQNGLSGWGQAPAGMFGVPGPPPPTWSLGGVSGWGSWPGSTPGWSPPPYSMSTRPDGMTLYGETPLTLHRRGETGGGASAVAAPSPSPTGPAAVTPTYSGTAPVGTRETVMRWLPQVQQMAAKYGVPAELVLAVMHNESGGDPKAQSGYNPGQGYARGLMQVMPFHFQDGEDPFDPMTNLDKGVKFLGAMYKQYGNDPQKAMAAYFGGPGAIDSAGNIKRGLSDINISIGNYLDKKFAPAYAAYQQALRGTPPPGMTEQPPPRASNGVADLVDLWGWLGGSRQPVTGKFGAQDGPYPGTGHRGMDIGTPLGTALTSPIAGTVIAAGDVGGGYGNQVRIQTPYGSVLLGHLGSVNVQRGQQVAVGTPLGVTGNTGKSTGPHLHFELRDQNDNAIDPARYYRW